MEKNSNRSRVAWEEGEGESSKEYQGKAKERDYKEAQENMGACSLS